MTAQCRDCGREFTILPVTGMEYFLCLECHTQQKEN